MALRCGTRVGIHQEARRSAATGEQVWKESAGREAAAARRGGCETRVEGPADARRPAPAQAANQPPLPLTVAVAKSKVVLTAQAAAAEAMAAAETAAAAAARAAAAAAEAATGSADTSGSHLSLSGNGRGAGTGLSEASTAYRCVAECAVREPRAAGAPPALESDTELQDAVHQIRSLLQAVPGMQARRVRSTHPPISASTSLTH